MESELLVLQTDPHGTSFSQAQEMSETQRLSRVVKRALEGDRGLQF